MPRNNLMQIKEFLGAPILRIPFVYTQQTTLQKCKSPKYDYTSEATPSTTPFFKKAYKISHPPRLYVSWVDLPSFATSSKIWPNFSNKVFLNLKLSKNHLNKKCAPNLIFFNEKKIQIDLDDF